MLRMIIILKIAYKSENMKLILNSIIKSLKELADIGIVVFFIWTFFAILGVQLFKDKFGYCGFPEKVGVNFKKCKEIGEIWRNHQNNFDDIFNAYMTLYIVSTYDHLGIIINVAANSNEKEFVIKRRKFKKF